MIDDFMRLYNCASFQCTYLALCNYLSIERIWNLIHCINVYLINIYKNKIMIGNCDCLIKGKMEEL